MAKRITKTDSEQLTFDALLASDAVVEKKSVETAKVAESTKPVSEKKPVETAKVTEPTKPVAEKKPVETAKVETPQTGKIVTTGHEEISDEKLQDILDESEKMREKLAQIDEFFKSKKFTSPYDNGGILDSEVWVKDTFTLSRVKNGEKVIKTVKAYDCYKSEQYATRLAYQLCMIKVKASCGFYDKKATTRFTALTYKLYLQRVYLQRLIAAYDDGDIYSLCPLDGKKNVYTDIVIFDLFQEAISNIYACMTENKSVGEIYNYTLNALNKYMYAQSSYKGGIVNENGKQHRKYQILSLDAIQDYISAAESDEIESGILPQLNDAEDDDYFTIVDSCVQFDKQMKIDLYICAREKFLNDCTEKKRLKYRKIFTAFCTGISNREIAKRLSDDKSCITEGGVRKIVKKIKQCGLQVFEELYPDLYKIFTCTDSEKKVELSRVLSQNRGVSNKPQIPEKSEDFIDCIIHKWNNVG